MKRILLLSSYCYRNANANGLCAIALYDELNSSGYDAYIIGYGDETTTTDRISSTKHLVFYHNEFEEKRTQVKSKIALVTQYIISPYTDKKLIQTYTAFAAHVCEVNKIDTVISMYFPLEMVAIGRNLKRSKPKLNFIIYELDSVADGIQPNKWWAKIITRSFERWNRKAYLLADKVLVMQSHTNYVRTTYPDTFKKKIAVVDLPILRNRCDMQIHNTQDIYFFYTGILDIEYRSPQRLLDLFAAEASQSRWRLDFYSKGNCEHMLDAVAKTDSRIRRNGYISESALDKEIEKADFFISIGNTNSNSTPSKIFFYMSYGKPIIHFSLQNCDICTDYLAAYPLSLIMSLQDTTEEMARKIEIFVKLNKNSRVKYEEINQLFVKNTPAYSVEKILGKHKDEE